jgi:hypothetical protein
MKGKSISLGQPSVYRILKKEEVNEPLEEPRKRLKYIRWKRDAPNDLWRCDRKYVKEHSRWPCCHMDDHPKFPTSARLYDNATSGNTMDCLLDGFRRYGTPRQILTDHGAQFYSARHGESTFDKKLNELRIEHMMSGTGRPTTTGKWRGSSRHIHWGLEGSINWSTSLITMSSWPYQSLLPDTWRTL